MSCENEWVRVTNWAGMVRCSAYAGLKPGAHKPKPHPRLSQGISRNRVLSALERTFRL